MVSMATKEQEIQNRIRLALNPFGRYFRMNVGKAYTGNHIEFCGRDVLIHDYRVFSTGLPNGFPDLAGFTMVNGIPIFTGIEVKTPKGKVRKEQEQFQEFLRQHNAICGIARSDADAIEIIKSGVDKIVF